MSHTKNILLSLLLLVSTVPSFAQSEEVSSLPENVWELMGTCVKSEKFDFLREHFDPPVVDANNNLVFSARDYAVGFFFRPNTHHLNQIRVDLDYYDGQDILGLHKHMTKRQIKKLRQPVQILNYGNGAYFRGYDYSILAAFEGWPIRKLVRFTLIYKGEYYPDRDMDGVADSIDQCPDVVGSSFYLGCPQASGTPQVPGSKAMASEFCFLVDTIASLDVNFAELAVEPLTEDLNLDHILVPHTVFDPGIHVEHFQHAYLVESEEAGLGKEVTLQFISFPIEDSLAETTFQIVRDSALGCSNGLELGDGLSREGDSEVQIKKHTKNGHSFLIVIFKQRPRPSVLDSDK